MLQFIHGERRIWDLNFGSVLCFCEWFLFRNFFGFVGQIIPSLSPWLSMLIRANHNYTNMRGGGGVLMTSHNRVRDWSLLQQQQWLQKIADVCKYVYDRKLTLLPELLLFVDSIRRSLEELFSSCENTAYWWGSK